MENEKRWVDYQEIKSTVTMEMALKHYDAFESLSKVPGKNALGICPIHHGSNPRQFSVCLSKNIWRCFGQCDAGGNVLDFVSMMEGGITIRDSAILLKKLFIDMEGREVVAEENKHEEETNKNQKEPVIKTEAVEEEEKAVNPTLEFKLKSITTDHPFFKENDISQETADYFGMGYCTKGLMKGRIAIPIHDHHSNLVAYCGRSVTAEQAEEEGKYKMPQNFARAEVVFNLDRQQEASSTLILVEGFIAVIKAHQSGIRNVVSLMASNLTKGQEELIFRHLGPSGKLLLLFSASEYSQKCANECLARFSSRLFVKKINISHMVETPCQLTAEEFRSLI
jgi:DNA primase